MIPHVLDEQLRLLLLPRPEGLDGCLVPQGTLRDVVVVQVSIAP